MQKRSSLTIFKAVIFALVLRELRTRLSMRRMGAFWFVFEPMLYIIIMVLERTYVRVVHIQIGGMDYLMFMITGIVPHLMFKNIALLGMGAIDANRSLFVYRQIKPLDCIVARAIVECALRALVYALLMFISGFWLGYDISIARPLDWLGVLFLGVLFSFSLSIFFCILVEAMPNIKTVISVIFMPVTFLSDSFIPITKLPDEILRWLAWNPFLQLSIQLRTAITPAYPILPGIGFNYVIFLTLVLLPSALMLYHARRDNLVSI